MNTTVYLKDTLSKLESLYHEMQGRFEAPVLQDMGGAKRFRYRSLSESLACFLKGAKAISTLAAALVLLRAGHTQEIGALCRMVSDLHNEIHFLFAPQDGEEFSKAQLQFLEDFFQEEFDKPMNALGSTQKRASVPAKKIHAAFGKIAEASLNPSDAQEVLRTIHRGLSGYVHGAYPQIMEMYGGHPPRFHLSGMPSIAIWRHQLVAHVYTATIVTILVARKLGVADVETKARELVKAFEDDTGCKTAKTAQDMIGEIKRKTT